MSAAPSTAAEPEEGSYQDRACRLLAEHAELFPAAPPVRVLRVLPRTLRPAHPASRSRGRQLRLPLRTTMRRA